MILHHGNCTSPSRCLCAQHRAAEPIVAIPLHAPSNLIGGVPPVAVARVACSAGIRSYDTKSNLHLLQGAVCLL